MFNSRNFQPPRFSSDLEFSFLKPPRFKTPETTNTDTNYFRIATEPRKIMSGAKRKGKKQISCTNVVKYFLITNIF